MRPFLTLHHPARAREFHDKRLWRDDTFYTLLQGHAKANPDRPCLRDGTRTLSWAELRARVDGAAAAMAFEGLVGGDRVSIWMSNKIEAIIAFLACSRAGLACNPSLHRSYTREEVRGLLDRLSSRILITENGWGADRSSLSPGEAFKNVESLRAIWTPENFPAADYDFAQSPVDDADKVTYLAFTSGTTGIPKCVMHSDNTLLANARDLVRIWKHDPDTVILSLSPLSHHIAWVAVAQWLLSGALLVTDDRPVGMSRFDWIVETGATYVMGVPTHALDVLAEQTRRGGIALGRVSIFYMAGSAIPPSVAKAFARQGIKPQNVYGMTENSSHQFTHPDDDERTILSTCGRGGAGYEVRIFDAEDRDRPAAPGEVGEIGGRGAALMLGYFDNQQASETSFNRDGWFMSGDLGQLDAHGNLTIEGRLKDLIIRGGHNIYPTRIEALAMRHPAVVNCACFPIADERLGERVCISIIGDVDSDALIQHLDQEGLSRYDMPEWFLRVENFPLTASGKVLKRELDRLVRSGDLQPRRISGSIVQ